jgi:hypothetical protein
VQSNTEAEYIAGALATNESIWLRWLLSEIGEKQLNPTVLNTDNQASILLARNPIFHKATKHIEVRYHHMRWCFESGTIVPTYVSTDNQIANVLMKPLARDKHEKFTHAMGLVWKWTLLSGWVGVLKLNGFIRTLHSFIFPHFDMSSHNHLPFWGRSPLIHLDSWHVARLRWDPLSVIIFRLSYTFYLRYYISRYLLNDQFLTCSKTEILYL